MLDEVTWYKEYLQATYDYRSIEACLRYKDPDLPDRLKDLYNFVYSGFTQYLITEHGYTRFGRSVSGTVLWFCKAVGRLALYDSIVGITYTRSRGSYARVSRAERNYVSYEVVIRLMDYLISCGYITNYVGYRVHCDLLVKSMFIPSDELVGMVGLQPDCEGCRIDRGRSVVLRCADKVEVEFNLGDSGVVGGLEEIMDRYNSALENVTISMNGYNIPEVFFRRIYNENLNSGGRCYDNGQVQSRSRFDRSTTLIDGEPTVMLDFKSLHPRMCYTLSNVKLSDSFDPYDCGVQLSVDSLEVEAHKSAYNLVKYNPVRNLCKRALLIMLNSPNYHTSVKAFMNEVFKDRYGVHEKNRKFVGLGGKMVAETVIDSLLAHNSRISADLNRGVALNLQRMDSDIINLCIKWFLLKGEVLLPVHDEIIVRKGMEGYALECMRAAYKSVLGTEDNCLIERVE